MKRMKIIDGKSVSLKKEEYLSKRIAAFSRQPSLAIVVVGDRADSQVYVRQKMKAAERVGVVVRLCALAADSTTDKLVDIVNILNEAEEIDGIIVQLPLPSHVDARKVVDSIDQRKDVDGLTTLNQGKFITGSRAFSPATARGIISLLKESGVILNGKRVTVVGRSLLVGRPVALLAEREGATIIQCHSKTKKLQELTRLSDVLIVAAGKPKLITLKHVHKGQVVIDVGSTVVVKKNVKVLVGDVDFGKVSKIVKAISPVPGGVGPMTVVSLLENVCDAYEDRSGDSN